MKIIGFAIDKISAHKKTQPAGKVEVKSNVDIKDIKKEEIGISDKPGLKFNFEFIVEYNPKVAVIEVCGAVAALDDKNESKEILKQWKKKKFEHPSRIAILNVIMDKCNLKALELENELNLPLHIPLPKLRPAGQQQGGPANYAG